MMNKVFMKKLFGARYEKLIRTIFINFVIFGGVKGSGTTLGIAPYIIYLMTVFLTVFDMWQAFSSEDNSKNMKNMIMMPFDNKGFVLSYVFSIGLYTFVCRTMTVWSLIFALSDPEAAVTVNSILWVINGTVLSAVIFAEKKFRISAAVWIAAVFALYFLPGSPYLYSLILLVSIALALLVLMKADAYAFYIGEDKKNQRIKSRNNSSVMLYILRYMKAHKNYLLNIVFLWGIAAMFPLFIKDFPIEDSEILKDFIPVGFAIVCINTPVGILLSSDRSLEQAVRFLPGQKKTFCLPYCVFIFICNFIAESVYVVSCCFQFGNIRKEFVLAAVLFAAQGAVLSVLLEWFRPLRNWKIENDLWHHPRKYVVPVVIMLLSGIVSIVPVSVYVFTALFVAEAAFLLYSVQKD